MGLHGVSEELRTFEAMRSDLVRRHPGRFAVVCSSRLLGVYESVDDALLACSRAFDAGGLPDGAPVMVNEIADSAPLRVVARPYIRGGGLVAGEI